MTQKNTNESHIDEVFVKLVIGIGIICLANAKVIGRGISKLRLENAAWGFTIITLASILFVIRDYHLLFLNWLHPNWFDYDLLVKLKSYGWIKNFLSLMSIFSAAYLWCLGVIPTTKIKRYQNALDDVTLKNAKDFKPKVVDYRREDAFTEVITVMVPGIGAESLDSVKAKLEASLAKPISEIRKGKNPKYAEIILGGRILPKHTKYQTLEQNLKASGEFIIGESKKGTLTENISNLPHMMIAGTVGGGKSVFFKQVITGLLHSSNHTQLYLIDLKGGLEFRHFETLPNVKVAKTPEDAVRLLKLVKSEMTKRFEYLEQSGFDKINPTRDKRDRIILGIDEASVLFANARRDSEDYDLIIEARNLTENIAKLSRAAAIHLILATQKVSKETIDTRIQEVVDGRMCFKLNTIEGSVRVLGSGDAAKLSAIAGRGIWQYGSKQMEVQAPIITNFELKDKIKVLKDSFKSGSKSLHQDMLETKVERLILTKTSVQMPAEENFEGL